MRVKEPNIDLRLMDCMELMSQYDDNHFDLAIVDPEYGIGEGNKTSHGSKKGQVKFTTYKKKNWDNKPPDKIYFDELFRVSKNQIIWGANYFSNYLPPSKGYVFWDKDFSEKFSFSAGELAFTSFNIALKKVKIKRSEWINCTSNNRRIAEASARIHPTQKPVALYRWLLTNYAKEGDLILDTHLGSGSIAIACHELGFDLVGSELDPDYYAAMMKRFDQHARQKLLF